MSEKLCMFCERPIDPDELTQEHFIPKALWENDRPSGTKTLPAHRSCNQRFAKDNEYFRDVLVMQEGARQHSEAQKLQDGKMERKLKKRPGSFISTFKNLGIRPVRTPSGIEIGNHPTFQVDMQQIERVLCNVMKGIFYVSQGRPMPQGFIVTAKDANLVDQAWLTDVVGRMCPWQSFGDTVFCCRYVANRKKPGKDTHENSEPIAQMAFLMQFYEHRVFVGDAFDPEFFVKDGDPFVAANAKSSILVTRWSAER